jgi:putative redox protein
MQVKINWVSGVAFSGQTEGGHKIMMDGSPEVGGQNLGARPMETVLIGTGGCSAIDVVLILKKARQDVTDCQVVVNAERATTDPKVFTTIHFHYVVTGNNLNATHVERAVKLSAEKYCSATAMMAKTAVVTFDFALLMAPQ